VTVRERGLILGFRVRLTPLATLIFEVTERMDGGLRTSSSTLIVVWSKAAIASHNNDDDSANWQANFSPPLAFLNFGALLLPIITFDDKYHHQAH
jgi:hypothetical protein